MSEAEKKEELTEQPLPAEPQLTADEEQTAEHTAAAPSCPRQEGQKANLFAILAGLLIFCGLLLVIWRTGGVGAAERGILYTKDNALYYYDLRQEPFLVQENISDGGANHYYYSAWGASVSEDGRWIYYAANISPSGSFDFYRRDAGDAFADALPIASDVYDYQVSADGSAAAYLVIAEGEDSVRLCSFDGKGERVIAEDLQWQQNLYDLSADGKYLVYIDAYGMLRTESIGTDKPSVVLTDAVASYVLLDESNMLYYVAQNGETYDIYGYDFQTEPVLAAENVSYMEPMANGRDLLYCTVPMEKIPYSSIITDDMADADAALSEADGEAWEEKRMRDEIREAMAAGEGIAPIVQDAYVLTNGEKIKVADNVVFATSVQGDAPFVTGYRISQPEPIALSEIAGGLQAVELAYYLALSNGAFEMFLADTNGMQEALPGYQPLLSSIQLSSDGKRAAYLDTDANTGGNILMEMTIGDAESAAAVAADVEGFAFLGGDGALAYCYTQDGVSMLTAGEQTLSNVSAVEFAQDRRAVYYLANIDTETETGQMQLWEGAGEPQMIADGICAFQNLGGGRLALLGQYDAAQESGALCYFDGKRVSVLEEAITAIYAN